MVFRRLVTVCSLLAIFVVSSTNAFATDTTLVELKNKTPIAADSTRILWSEYDASTDSYTLKSRLNSDGSTTGLPIAARSIPYDVDLGTDKNGNSVAVYSRCTQEPFEADSTASDWDLYSWYQDWTHASGCQVYKFDFTTNQESRILLGAPGYSEVEPSISLGRVAWITFPDGQYGKKKSNNGRLTTVYVENKRNGDNDLQLTVKKTASSTGCAGYGETGPKDMRKCVKKAQETFTDLDFNAGKVAVVARFNYPNSFYHLEVGSAEKYGKYEVVTAGGVGGVTTRGIASPQLTGSNLFFALVCDGPCDSYSIQQIRRYNLKKAQLEGATVKKIGNIAVSGSNTYYEDSGIFDFNARNCGPDPSSTTSCAIKLANNLSFAKTKNHLY